jgi:hypothetical protein
MRCLDQSAETNRGSIYRVTPRRTSIIRKVLNNHNSHLKIRRDMGAVEAAVFIGFVGTKKASHLS